MSFLVSARPPRPPRVATDPAAEVQPAMTASAELDRHLSSAIAEFSSPKESLTMSTPIAGGFVAQIRAMMDEARAGVAQARADGLAKVGEAVGKLNDAKDATAHVSATMVKRIEDEAASVLSELGQISNDLDSGS